MPFMPVKKVKSGTVMKLERDMVEKQSFSEPKLVILRASMPAMLPIRVKSAAAIAGQYAYYEGMTAVFCRRRRILWWRQAISPHKTAICCRRRRPFEVIHRAARQRKPDGATVGPMTTAGISGNPLNAHEFDDNGDDHVDKSGKRRAE